MDPDIYLVDTKELSSQCNFIDIYPYMKNKGHIIHGFIQCSTTWSREYCIESKLKRFVERPQWCVLTTTSIGPSLPGKVFALELLLGISLGEFFNYIDINIHLHSYQSDIISQILNHDERITHSVDSYTPHPSRTSPHRRPTLPIYTRH